VGAVAIGPAAIARRGAPALRDAQLLADHGAAVPVVALVDEIVPVTTVFGRRHADLAVDDAPFCARELLGRRGPAARGVEQRELPRELRVVNDEIEGSRAGGPPPPPVFAQLRAQVLLVE